MVSLREIYRSIACVLTGEPKVRINYLDGPSRHWRCPKCKAIISKGSSPMLGNISNEAVVVGTVTCGNCGRSYGRDDIYGGKYDMPEVDLHCPNCGTHLRGPKDDLLGQGCPSCNSKLPRR